MKPDRYLSQFDTLNLSAKPDRRMGVLLLHEYCGAVMYEVGVDYLDFGDGFRKRSVREQWDDIKTRLETVGGLDIPDEYESIGERVYEARTDVIHNKVHNPSKSNVQDLRSKAPDWNTWLSNAAVTFRKEREALTPYEGVEELIKKNTRLVEQKPLPDHDQMATELIRDMKKDAQSIKSQAESLKHDHQNIDEFARLLRLSLNLREDVQYVQYQSSAGGDDTEYVGERLDDYQ